MSKFRKAIKEQLGGKFHFEAVFRAAAQDSELSGGPTPGVQLPTAMVLAAFPYGRTHEIPCFFGGGADLYM